MNSMLTPEVAASILLGVSVMLLVIVPLMDGSKRFSKFISLRYTLVAVALIMALGCILDFSHLAESSRNIVLMGGIILVGIFVLVRSLEKLKLGNKVIELSAEKDGLKVGAKIEGTEKEVEKVKEVIKDEAKEEQIDPIDLENIEDEKSDD